VEYDEIVERGFVNPNPTVSRLWMNEPDALYWVDYGTSDSLEIGLDRLVPVFWTSVLEYAQDKVAGHRLSEELANANER
jgi:hypothetical protein